jgi:hypothetical protein
MEREKVQGRERQLGARMLDERWMTDVMTRATTRIPAQPAHLATPICP